MFLYVLTNCPLKTGYKSIMKNAEVLNKITVAGCSQFELTAMSWENEFRFKRNQPDMKVMVFTAVID